jgi:hypothetical protein
MKKLAQLALDGHYPSLRLACAYMFGSPDALPPFDENNDEKPPVIVLPAKDEDPE